MTLTCPKCSGTQFQSVRMIYESGVNTSVISGQSFATNGNNSSVGLFQGTNTSTSALSQRFAPPDTGRRHRVGEKIKAGNYMGYGMIPFVIILFMVLPNLDATDNKGGMYFVAFASVCASIGGFIYASTFRSQLSEATLQDLRAEEDVIDWSNSVVCLTCSNKVVLPREDGRPKMIW